jgi:hypothetical protein
MHSLLLLPPPPLLLLLLLPCQLSAAVETADHCKAHPTRCGPLAGALALCLAQEQVLLLLLLGRLGEHPSLACCLPHS